MTTADPRTIGVSIPVPSPYAEQLEDVRRAVGDPLADAVPSHITLMPPTDLAQPAAADLVSHLAAVAAKADPFRMTLRGTGTFRPISPVVFVAIAEGISSCEQLERRVRSGPVHRELDFPYHPHVTIAHGVDTAALDQAFTALATYECTFPVEAFDLYEHGADRVWRSVQRFPFGGG
ncbi:2'-5' RNA ligase family protein [Luteipulveratus mongoliensis]|uniref:2'-5' RNA ligase n=1 Tax=Luteipulveratus mongoliensis TaxID=571913 RepID=A0A0K1JHD9_9MICO|nr:2'-5' RNA ligase family protein [Luteipulveratus mongoliensis]AKU16116.1 2'-5' RNA ligase [Luteipulveratus mongoliensis]